MTPWKDIGLIQAGINDDLLKSSYIIFLYNYTGIQLNEAWQPVNALVLQNSNQSWII